MTIIEKIKAMFGGKGHSCEDGACAMPMGEEKKEMCKDEGTCCNHEGGCGEGCGCK